MGVLKALLTGALLTAFVWYQTARHEDQVNERQAARQAEAAARAEIAAARAAPLPPPSCDDRSLQDGAAEVLRRVEPGARLRGFTSLGSTAHAVSCKAIISSADGRDHEYTRVVASRVGTTENIYVQFFPL